MLENIQIQECMTHPAITVTANMSVRLAQQIMCDYHIRHLPVVHEKKRVGVLTEVDVFRLLLQQADAPMPDPQQTSDYPVAALP